MNIAEFNKLFTNIQNNPKFQKLKEIGGEYYYHREGNAYEHTMMVVGAAKLMFGPFDEMVIIALLHDIGKIVSSTYNEETGFWNYPNHSAVGASILPEFIPENHPLYKKAYWYINNHIKPMFFNEGTNLQDFLKQSIPEGCSIKNLCKLVLCDWAGSNSIKNQDPDKEKTVRFYAQED